MDDPKKIPPERNATVHIQHRREVQRQIYLPIIIALVLVLAGVITIIIYGIRAESTLRRWADVSLIWVIIPAMFIGLIIMIVVIGVLYGITRGIGVLPKYGNIAQGYFFQAEAKVLQVSNLLVEPFLRLRSSWYVARHSEKIIKKKPNSDGNL
jgi:hypothetical protein